MTSYCAMKFAVRGLTQAVGKQIAIECAHLRYAYSPVNLQFKLV